MAVQTITTSSAPWSEQQPFLQQIFGLAQGLYGSGGPGYFPGSTVAGFSPETEQALQGITRAGVNNPLLGQAQQFAGSTLSGNYLNANPWLDQTFNKAADAVSRQFSQATLPGINSAFSQAGRLGSGMHQNAADWAADAYGRNLTNLATDIYGGNYANERQLQNQVLGLTPSLGQQQFQGLNYALQAGQTRDELAQMQRQDEVNRYNFEQQRPYDALNRYLTAVGGGYGQASTQTRPIYNNNTAQNVGLALGGLGLLSQFF